MSFSASKVSQPQEPRNRISQVATPDEALPLGALRQASQRPRINLRKHLCRSDLLSNTPAEDSEVITVLFPGDVERDYFVAYHVVPGYGDPRHDRGGELGYESDRLVIDGVLDAESGDVVEIGEGRAFQLREIIEDRLEEVLS